MKIAMDAKPMKAQIFKNQNQMPNLLEQLDVAAQTINSNSSGEAFFTSLDLKYAFSQLKVSDSFSNHCNFNVVCGDATGTYILIPVFTCSQIFPKGSKRQGRIPLTIFRGSFDS